MNTGRCIYLLFRHIRTDIRPLRLLSIDSGNALIDGLFQAVLPLISAIRRDQVVEPSRSETVVYRELQVMEKSLLGNVRRLI